MKKNGYFVKSLVVLSLVSTLAMADNDIEINDNNGKDVVIKSSIQISDKASEEFENKEAKIGVEKVVQVIKDKSLGKILSVKLENQNGNLVYTTEVLKNNQMIDITIDAANGEILASIVDKKDSDEEEDENEAWYKFW